MYISSGVFFVVIIVIFCGVFFCHDLNYNHQPSTEANLLIVYSLLCLNLKTDI